ncbi:hypothetical protein [Spirosoma oryzicola]|uniref:hypothetical protein n=1 Tax=Spirosoma oryzicola TaxID=2898794 RepID=UPI001E4BABC3|nr:hypothetical protein [Spirosoma oryzicola]UHG89473.1 hypothetical protein LQ777_14590 [Spirosoma oryzicola]
MRKVVSISLFILLLWHVLAYVVTSVGTWKQQENDLSKRLSVYRSVDSLVEFYVPLSDSTDQTVLTRITQQGFTHHGQYYAVVSLALNNDTLYIAGLESDNHSFWQDDLLTFLNPHLSTGPETNRKASQLLKLLLKEYSPGSRIVLYFLNFSWRESTAISIAPFMYSTRSEPTYSLPPERVI